MVILKKIKHYFFPPLIVILITLLVYGIYGIFPFGSKTVSWCDMNQQTVPLLMNLKDILNGKGSIFYSTANGAGMNFWGVFLFFLASPFYLLVAFIEKSQFNNLVNIFLILKLAASSATALAYFNFSHKKLNYVFKIILSVMYAFCGFGLMYYQTLVWLDVMYLFPIFMISVEKMCSKQKPALYIIMLSLMVAVNFYLSYMIVIFLLLAVPLYIFTVCKKKERKKTSFCFVRSSIIAMFITAPFWLCSFLQVSNSARSENYLVEFITGGLFESLKEKLCLLMCTAFAVAALPFFFRSRLCKNRLIRYKLILLLFLIIPVIIDPANKMWHTGSYQCFPLRFGYIITLIFLSLTAHLLESPDMRINKEKNKLYPALIFIFTLIFAALAALVLIKGNFKSGYVTSLWVGSDEFLLKLILFASGFILYYVCLSFFRRGEIDTKQFSLLISLIMTVEVTFNFAAYVGIASDKYKVYDDTMKLENMVNDDGFYRVKSEEKYVHVNMTGGIGYNSISHYTSLTPEKYMYAMKKLGYSSYWMEVGSNGGTILTDAVLAANYSIGMESDFASYQNALPSDGDYSIAKSTLSCEAGIISDTDPGICRDINTTDRFEVQKTLAENLFKTDDFLKKYEYKWVTDGKITYEDGKYHITETDPKMAHCYINYNIDVKGHEQLYFDLFDNLSNRLYEPQYSATKVYVNGKCICDNYPYQINNGILNLGEFNNETIEITIVIKHDVSAASFGVFGIDIDGLESALKNLKTTSPEINGNKINISCLGEESEYLYLSIPWDSGFTARLNGEKTELYRVNDAFCAIKLEGGENEIEMVYYPPGFKISLLISLLGIAFLILFLRRKANSFYGISQVLTVIVSGAVISVIYIIMPMIYFIGIIII